jgi:cytochrome c556
MLKPAWNRPPLLKSTLAALLAGLVLAGCGAPVDNHPGQPVTHRKQIFHEILQSFEPMGVVIRGHDDYDKSTFLQHALALETLAKEPWSYFTAGSDYPPTRAKPNVWKDQANFKADEQKLIDTTTKLAEVSQSGDLDKIRPAYADVAQTCKACHKEYRKSLY